MKPNRRFSDSPLFPLARQRCSLAYSVLLALLFACPGTLLTAAFDSKIIEEIDDAILAAIETGKTPGGVLWLESDGQSYAKAYGNLALEPAIEKARLDGIYDSASLTKVIATTPAIMLLLERGRLHLDAPVSQYLDDFDNGGKESITIRHLLTHTSGLRPGISHTIEVDGVSRSWTGYDTAVSLAKMERTQAAPGSKFIYSDINFILLSEIVERLTGRRFEEFVTEEVFDALAMNDTSFRPRVAENARVAPTKWTDGDMLRGIPNNPICRKTGRAHGHAGMFTTAADLATFARMMLNNGVSNGERFLEAETVHLMTAAQSPAGIESRRGLGWDIDSSYSGQRGDVFPIGGYGHTGFAGPSIWIDPYSQSFAIFMCNRIHPDGSGDVRALRRTIGTLAAQAVEGFDFDSVSSALTKTLNGIDALENNEFASLDGLRVGLITNHTGRNRSGVATIDLLYQAKNVELVALFSPEHGIRGEKDEKVGDSVDEGTGLPIYSLYGESRKPNPRQLEGLDTLVFDIQDIGCRFYTYISTMGLAMEAAAENGKRFITLDRVNPLGGRMIEGPLRRGESEFIAYHDIPVRHGMTIGELALMIREERDLDLDLKIVPLEDWKRGMLFDQTKLPWINPSPNMRSLTQALLYPGIGLLETTNLSVGRGTDTPFEVIGAPYIDSLELAEELNRLNLPGLSFVPIRFSPNASKFANERCQGVNIILTDRARCRITESGIAIAHTLYRLYGDDFDLPRFNRLLRHPNIIERIESGHSWQSIIEEWQDEEKAFAERRKPYLLY